MATELAPQPHGRDAGARSPGRDDVVDLTRLEFHEAPESVYLPGALEVELPIASRVERVDVRRFARGAAGVLMALLAPLLVLLAALQLPVSDAVRGGALVAGWIGLGVLARVVHDDYERRRHR